MITVSVLKTQEAKDLNKTNYKYLIGNGCYNYSAFVTDKGFKDFLKRGKMKMKVVEVGIYHYRIDKTIEDRYFWNLSQIENLDKCVKHKGLSNGSVVDCYTYSDDNKVIIYRPNPNAKEVYKPLDIKEHIEFNKLNG